MRELEFLYRFIDLSLSSKVANKCYICKQLSLLCETITYFRFNRLSYLVATSVCQKKKKKARVKVIEFWIEVARECVNGGNFNSLMGIITGLNMIPVARYVQWLTKCWNFGSLWSKLALLKTSLQILRVLLLVSSLCLSLSCMRTFQTLHASSEILDILCMKSQIEGHSIPQLGSTANAG